MRVFVYGTLLDADVRIAVLGRTAAMLPVEPATLEGYRRVAMRGRTYPVIVPDANGTVAGALLRGLSRAAFAKLEAYETDEYRVADVVVTSGAERSIAAKAFVASGRARPSPLPWEIEDWRRRYKRAFLRKLRAGEGVRQFRLCWLIAFGDQLSKHERSFALRQSQGERI